MRGIRIPLFEETISSMELLLGVLVPIPTLSCEKSLFDKKRMAMAESSNAFFILSYDSISV